MALNLEHKNAKEVAHAVQDELAAHGIDPLSSLPYNRFDKMDVSTWWVNPSKENPAYKHGKYAFVPELGGCGEFFCGLHVEKGFGKSVALVMSSAKSKRMILREDWIWHRFVSDLAAGKLDAPVTRMFNDVGSLARVVVQAYYCKNFGDSDFDPYDTGDDWDQIEFSATGGSITAVEHTSRTPSGLLRHSAKAKCFAELGKAMLSIPHQEWVWVNFWVGYDFALSKKRRKRGSWTAADLDQRLLQPLKAWFE